MERLYHWFYFSRIKHCHSCCLFCRFYNRCKMED